MNETLQEYQRNFELLKKEMLAESQNGMKQIARDWKSVIFPEYKYFSENYSMTAQESFYSALLISDIDLTFGMDDLTLKN